MARDLTVTNSPTHLPSLGNDAWLESEIADPVVTSYSDDFGYSEHAVAWRPPAVITDRHRERAAGELERLRLHLGAAAADSMTSWLESLGVLTASGKMGAGDAALKLGAYSRLMAGRSVACFTAETLEEAARVFKWFPTYGELAGFLDGIEAPLKRKAARLEAIIHGKDRETEVEETWGRPRQVSDAVERALAEMRRNLGARS